MNWKKGDDYFLASVPAGFTIARGDVGGRVSYMAIRLGKAWPESKWRRPVHVGMPDGWNGSAILHVERDLDPVDDAGRLAALDRCKAACHV